MRRSFSIACLAALWVTACGGGTSPAEATWETQTVAPAPEDEDTSVEDAASDPTTDDDAAPDDTTEPGDDA